MSQLREENSGATRGSLEGQIEITDGDWRGREGLVERGVATDDVGSYWVVTNLIGDFPVTTKEGNLSNASAETFTHGAVEGGTMTATAAAQLSQERGMEQRTLQVFTTENWVKGQDNPSGGGGGEDDGTINPTMEDCVDNGGTMASGGLPHSTVDQETLAGPQMEDVLVDSSSTTSEQGGMTVGGWRRRPRFRQSRQRMSHGLRLRQKTPLLSMPVSHSKMGSQTRKPRSRERGFASTFAQRKKISRRTRQTTPERSSSFLTRCLLSSDIRTN